MDQFSFKGDPIERKKGAYNSRSRIIQQLLGNQAMRQSKDSRKLSDADLQRMVEHLRLKGGAYFDIDSYLLPFDVI